MLDKDISAEELKSYIPTNFSCNLGSGSGCVCTTNEDYDQLNTKGGNMENTNH